jgi:hypothetical protein
MNEVGLMKAICDVYLLHAFNRIEPQRLGGVRGDEAGESDLDSTG